MNKKLILSLLVFIPFISEASQRLSRAGWFVFGNATGAGIGAGVYASCQNRRADLSSEKKELSLGDNELFSFPVKLNHSIGNPELVKVSADLRVRVAQPTIDAPVAVQVVDGRTGSSLVTSVALKPNIANTLRFVITSITGCCW